MLRSASTGVIWSPSKVTKSPPSKPPSPHVCSVGASALRARWNRWRRRWQHRWKDQLLRTSSVQKRLSNFWNCHARRWLEAASALPAAEAKEASATTTATKAKHFAKTTTAADVPTCGAPSVYGGSPRAVKEWVHPWRGRRWGRKLSKVSGLGRS